MKYRITHTTGYRYSSPVSICHNVVILSPQSGPYLEVRKHSLTIVPDPSVRGERRDFFGNTVNRFSVEEQHTQLSITAVSDVLVRPKPVVAPAGSPPCEVIMAALRERSDVRWLSVIPFTANSPRIHRDPVYAEFAARSLDLHKPVISAAMDLTRQIYSEFKYDKNATRVDTPTRTAFDGRHGVCQDFAHVAVSCLRSVGLPARYVSGYLRTIPPPGKTRLVGADQSHAWVSVYCGADLGWMEFDPTNNCQCSTDHLPIAFGRDYSDVVPMKGIFLGGGEPVLTVTVDVAPMADGLKA
ncbi:MAG: transglutaminase family protein [Planctomycetaceae bacterium]